jgi:internalin A
VFCVVFGLFVGEWRRAHRKKRIAGEVQRLGGRVHFVRPRPDRNEATGVVNGWLRVFLGDEYFAEVSDILLRPRSEEDLDLLQVFPEMTGLKLGGPAVTDAALARLIGFGQLECLELADSTISEQGLKSLTELPNLRRLYFQDCSLSDGSLKALTEFPKIRSLYFLDCSLSDDSLESLYGARSLVELRLRESDVTEAGILAIRGANPTWAVVFNKHIHVREDKKVHEDYLPSIQQLPQVKELAFKGPLTSDATLGVLKDARSLDSLRLVGCRVTDDGLRNLRGLTLLTRLYLWGTDATDSDCQITDRGLEHISHLSSLTDLTVYNCQFTDDGIGELAKMTSLRRLTLRNTAISDAGVAELQRALPGCTVTKYARSSGGIHPYKD